MNVKASGVVLANSLVYSRYGADANLLAVAKLQGKVPLTMAGFQLAKDYGDGSRVPPLKWTSVEYTDGFDDKRGGLGILRIGTEENQSMLLMKYGVHGGGHGHFDKLHFIFFDQGIEIVPDYGFCRWINIEPKFGGRYLPENKTYAKTTIAHNTVVVDQQIQNSGSVIQAEKVWGQRHFFHARNPDIHVMSAFSSHAYKGVKMQRTMFLIRDDRLRYPVVVDIYRLSSHSMHTYDYPIHFLGQPILLEFPYTKKAVLEPFGTDGGYQHLWVEAEGKTSDGIRFTWLRGHRYYTLTVAPEGETKIFMVRTGANDPNFNLRSEPAIVLRRTGDDMVFASVLEPHGYFNEGSEASQDARGQIVKLRVVGSNAEGTIVDVFGKNGLHWRVGVTHQKASETATHLLRFGGKEYQWTGNYFVNLHAERLQP